VTDIITDADKLACAERELKMRKRVYERWTDEGKMSAGKAAHEIACMEAIVKDYQAIAEKDRLRVPQSKERPPRPDPSTPFKWGGWF
jgi:hypothetical protein